MDEREQLTREYLCGQRRLLQSRLTSHLDPLLNSALTLQQFKLLTTVHFHGQSTMRQLATAMGVSLPTISGAVERLVDKGLLTRRENPQDRRVRLISMSPAGARLARQVEEAGELFVREVLAELDLDSLRSALTAHREVFAAAERLAARHATLGDCET